MAPWKLVLLLGVAVLVASCAAMDRPERSERGIALRFNDDVDDLENAIEQAQAHCARFDRFAVLQGVSDVGEEDRLLATFDCVETRGGGVALVVDGDDHDLEEAHREAGGFCEDFEREPVLQSVSEVDDTRIAAFNCVRES